MTARQTKPRQFVGRYGPLVRYHRIDNTGPCRARNVGISLACAPWIALCDSDDLWRPSYLGRQTELFRAVPGLEYAFGNFVTIDRHGLWSARSKFDDAPPAFCQLARTTPAPDVWLFTEPLYSRILRFQPIFQSTVVFSQDFFARIGGFNEQFGRTQGEDFEFTLRCVQESPVGALVTPLVGIRKHGENFSGNQLGTLLGEIRILQHARDHHRCAVHCLEIVEDEIIVRASQAAHAAFAAGDLDRVRALSALVPAGRRPPKLRVKFAIARCPQPIRRTVCALTLKMSAARRTTA